MLSVVASLISWFPARAETRISSFVNTRQLPMFVKPKPWTCAARTPFGQVFPNHLGQDDWETLDARWLRTASPTSRFWKRRSQ
jgi:hypothetical protein